MIYVLAVPHYSMKTFKQVRESSIYSFKQYKFAVDRQQLKWTGARSAGRMTTWGEPGMLSWMWAEGETTVGCVAKTCE
jgi:hypothetical protein